MSVPAAKIPNVSFGADLEMETDPAAANLFRQDLVRLSVDAMTVDAMKMDAPPVMGARQAPAGSLKWKSPAAARATMTTALQFRHAALPRAWPRMLTEP